MRLLGETRDKARSGYREFINNMQGPPREILTLNSLIILRSWKYPDFRSMIEKAEAYTVDSVGIRFAERLLSKRKTERYPGVEMAEDIISEGFPVFMWGGKPGVAERAAMEMKKKYPSADIKGVNDGYFSAGDEERIIDRISASGAAVVMIGLGMPAQQELAARIKKTAKAPFTIIGVGGSFDVLSNDIPRSPRFFIDTGTEWLWRVVRQPGRIARVMLLPYFFLKVVMLYLSGKKGFWEEETG